MLPGRCRLCSSPYQPMSAACQLCCPCPQGVGHARSVAVQAADAGAYGEAVATAAPRGARPCIRGGHSHSRPPPRARQRHARLAQGETCLLPALQAHSWSSRLRGRQPAAAASQPAAAASLLHVPTLAAVPAGVLTACTTSAPSSADTSAMPQSCRPPLHFDALAAAVAFRRAPFNPHPWA